MTVPADHVVGATGECQNYNKILSPAQLSRWKQAQTSKEPIEIVTLAEAKAAEKQKAGATKTWIFKAENVRDFAWTHQPPVYLGCHARQCGRKESNVHELLQ